MRCKTDDEIFCNAISKQKRQMYYQNKEIS